ncbi:MULTISPECIES: MerR family transcriptional regulator [unclassified Streptococcus]|uniref:MerR family transcriptional regulator n=1 Tax=unclassified Streptococcus TaxID=2608887 RepID=UPI0011B3C2E2|nr:MULTISPECIES: MerR family transcriptional regulator [unclassified Streptococcus]TWS94932.1 MerR family transcriptional regulator [Streptococcus sp. sy018]TWT11194.1 MerR family transcriptional regulator [Streptococcus sp. sy004]
MREKELRRHMAVFPIGSVMTLTDLTARQIRYYEEQGLILPKRSKGNRRLYSLNDMDRLLEIKDFLDDGLNMAAIKAHYAQEKPVSTRSKSKKPLSDADVRQILHDDLLRQGRFNQPTQHLGGHRLGR